MLGGQCRTCSFVFLHCSEIGGLKYKRERAKSPTLFKQYRCEHPQLKAESAWTTESLFHYKSNVLECRDSTMNKTKSLQRWSSSVRLQAQQGFDLNATVTTLMLTRWCLEGLIFTMFTISGKRANIYQSGGPTNQQTDRVISRAAGMTKHFRF